MIYLILHIALLWLSVFASTVNFHLGNIGLGWLWIFTGVLNFIGIYFITV